MACGKGSLQLSPTDRKIGETIKDDFLTIEEIANKINVPLFKVRSGIRSLQNNQLIISKDGKYKVKE